MRFEMDDFNFKDEIDFMNIQHQMDNQKNFLENKTLGFNEDNLYKFIEENKE